MLNSLLHIEEIIRRSDQGVTRPFLCRCDDGNLYFVKGRGAGRHALLCEWLAGHLAQSFGLPVPEFALASAPDALVALHPEGTDLGTGPVYASRYIPDTQELSVSRLIDVPGSQRLDVLAFDWWVCNSDRSLTVHGGNPNLLWNVGAACLVVIDHNAAFDASFDVKAFRDAHVFAADVPNLFGDLFAPDAYTERFEEALAAWQTVCNAIPDEWWFADDERTVPVTFELDATLELLERYGHKGFWGLTK